MSAKDKAQALVIEGIEDSFDDAVGALLDMGDISQATADRLLASGRGDWGRLTASDVLEAAGEAAFFDQRARVNEIRGFCDPSPSDSYDPEEGI